MDSIVRTAIVIYFVLGILSCGVQGQPLSECPRDATNCCECVTHPGCVWSLSTPSDASQSRCARDGEFSNVVNELVIPNNLNRPFNPHRKRFLKPQGGRLKMSIGLRKEIPIQVLARNRRVRLTVMGPSDYPDFSIETGDGMSCARRFRVRERTNARKKQKKLSVDCQVSVVGEVQKLHLIVDMTRCFPAKKEIKVNVRESGSRKFKLGVTSGCQCPCQYAESPEAERLAMGLETCREGEAMTQCVSPTVSGVEDATRCSGVNDYCRRNQNEPVCSGHGTCICGVCSCDFITRRRPHTDGDQSMLSNPYAPLGGRLRYQGAHCQCDDLSCQLHDGLLCGGPTKGMCRCGQCMCFEGYTGPACEVSTNYQTCIGPDGLVCSNLGDCVNGQCRCHGGQEGVFCEQCTNCRIDMCNMLAPCVRCFAFEEMETNNAMNCTAMCSIEDPPISFVLSDGMWPETANLCAMRRNECHYEFAYSADDSGEIVVNYQTELHCDDV